MPSRGTVARVSRVEKRSIPEVRKAVASALISLRGAHIMLYWVDRNDDVDANVTETNLLGVQDQGAIGCSGWWLAKAFQLVLRL
jgi:hypothetical protein